MINFGQCLYHNKGQGPSDKSREPRPIVFANDFNGGVEISGDTK